MPPHKSIPRLSLAIFIGLIILCLIITTFTAFIHSDHVSPQLMTKWQIVILSTNIPLIFILLNLCVKPKQIPSKNNIVAITLWVFISACLILIIIANPSAFMSNDEILFYYYNPFTFAITYILVSRILLYRNTISSNIHSPLKHTGLISSVIAAAVAIALSTDHFDDFMIQIEQLSQVSFSRFIYIGDFRYHLLLISQLFILLLITVTPFIVIYFPSLVRWFASFALFFTLINFIYEGILAYYMISGFGMTEQNILMVLINFYATRFLFSLTLIIYTIHLFLFRPPHPSP